MARLLAVGRHFSTTNILHFRWWKTRGDLYKELLTEKDKRLEEKDKHLEEKDKHLETKQIMITNLGVQLLASRGTMHCRGLLEHLLKDVHVQRQRKTKFNATNICESLGKNKKKVSTERMLLKVADTVFEQHQDSTLNIVTKQCSNTLYAHVYSKLSQEIHEAVHYGQEVGRIICMQLSCIFE